MDKSESLVGRLVGKMLKRSRPAAQAVSTPSPLIMLDRLHAGETPDYCLYLRPPGGQIVADAGLLTIDLESMLFDALAPLPPVVLDESGADPAAGRLPDESFITLAGAARILCVAPFAAALFEQRLQLLKQKGLLNRCIWIMPPAGTLGQSDWADVWADSRTLGAKLDIELSAYTPGGWLFRLDSAGSACTFRPIVNPNKAKIAAALEAICAQMQ